MKEILVGMVSAGTVLLLIELSFRWHTGAW